MITARFALQPFATHRSHALGAVTVAIARDGTVTLDRPGEPSRSGVLDASSRTRLASAVARIDPARIGRIIGAGATWAALTVPAGEVTVRYEGPPGELDPNAWRSVPAAVSAVMAVIGCAGIAARAGTLRCFRDGLPDVLDRAGLVMRFRRLRSHESRPVPWVVVYRDGRVEQWMLERVGESGRRLGQSVAQAAEIECATALARRIVDCPTPAHTFAHDATEILDLEVEIDGDLRGAWFCWGRASRNDAPLAAVIGAGAQRDFAALLAALQALSVRLS